jgi:pyroglutamyl-peptidase
MAGSQKSKSKMQSTAPVVLLTGFGPFPDCTVNASAKLVTGLVEQARKQIPRAKFISEILPTEWQAAPQRLEELFRASSISLALHFGVAREAQGFRIETQGLNACATRLDASGQGPANAELKRGGSEALPVTIPTRDIARALQSRGLPVSLSDNAGGYLCNAVLYHSLALAKAARWPCRAGFIHIPMDLSRPPLDERSALAGALEIVRVCLDTRSRAVS